jgi:hypothetical protein
MPPRPAWVEENDIAYRTRIFENFGGILTYGCPLEKFAGLWPALVPISREPAFQAGVAWLNLHDPLDPISGRLRAFAAQPSSCCPHPQDIGYCASQWLLLAHIKYLAHRRQRPDAASATLRWLLTDDPGDFHSREYGYRAGKWIAPGCWASFQRTLVAWVSWFAFAGALACLAGFVVPMVLEGSGHALHALSSAVERLAGGQGLAEFRPASWEWGSYWPRVGVIVAVGVVITLLLGWGARVFGFFRRDEDDTGPPRRLRRQGAAPRDEATGQDCWELPSQEPARRQR